MYDNTDGLDPPDGGGVAAMKSSPRRGPRRRRAARVNRFAAMATITATAPKGAPECLATRYGESGTVDAVSRAGCRARWAGPPPSGTGACDMAFSAMTGAA